MPIPDAHIASYFAKIADLLEICGDNPSRIRAYRDTARSVGEFGRAFKNLPCCALPERDGSSPADNGRDSTACLRATE